MNRILRHIFIIGIILSLCSCVKNDFSEPGILEGEATVELNFGFKDFEQVSLETKSTLDFIPESRVSNLFLYIFVNDKRYYAHYFDKSSLALDLEDLRDKKSESWIVNNRTSESATTNGTLRIHAPICKGANVILIANIDSDMLNISPEKLNMISSMSELKAMVASLNQEITSRNGLFPMSGFVSGSDPSSGPAAVDITETGIYMSGSTSSRPTIELERLDAKVVFNVRVATDHELTKIENGTTTTQRLKEFRPQSWQVVNLPKGCHIAAHFDYDPELGIFSTSPVMFETYDEKSFTYKGSNGKDTTVVSPVNGFSFYMLENRETPKNKVTSFHERERRNKDASGMYVTEGEVWTNAPEEGTYVIIKGEVVMDVDVSSEAKQQQLSADVTYYVHLGDISKDLNDYNVLRNTAYTYTITIKGVNNIELEVASSKKDDGSAADPGDVKENEPGAEGMVYIAKESIYTFDAHYGQRVFSFDAAYIDPKAVTWYVKTPFGREGTPDKIGEIEIPSGMDYEWVHFMINNESDSKKYKYSTDGGNTFTTTEQTSLPYSHNNMPYPGDSSDKLMNVVEFVEYVKAQKVAHDNGADNDFKTEFDQDWFDWYNDNQPEGQKISDPKTLINGKPGPWFRDRIYVTVYVDEFYYDKDPITGEESKTLWKKFVNQPNRIMHILCDNDKSLDKASSSTGSVVTIRQNSIQTPYNIDNQELESAWGCETTDENADSYLWYFEGESGQGLGNNRVPNDDLKNTSSGNGLYNTARIWGCVKSNGTSGGSWEEVRWDEYLDYDRPNDYKSENSAYNILFLKEDKACLKYSAMMRNRDNNGNGIIDPDEIRWYTASIGQLESLLLGELGLSEEAKLYPRKYSSVGKDEKYPAGHPYEGIRKWKLHVVSSTRFSDGYPATLWAEEGASISGYKQWECATFSVKCIRNLGIKSTDVDSFLYDDAAHRPQDLIKVIKPTGTIGTNSVYKFDCSRVNSKSKRFKTSIELEPYDENSEMSRLYDGFETGTLIEAAARVGVDNYAQLRTMLQQGKSPCPDGYRVPNIREAVLLHLYAKDSKSWWTSSSSPNVESCRIYTSTYYSMGIFGNSKNGWSGGSTGSGTLRASWNISSPAFGSQGNINLNGYKSQNIRCVRDWDPDTDL